ncbi:hypothetical protein E2562_031527 [Oryza meyeriana var. granulata]|uniref:Uncharacterized protein n=1 Tax=Oryza meyeriana var. granulata TaxID=110450 RepID=A0A6G1DQY4_9ORYZ|nr:hypothetical protein E2562_031527 [Oryza meyeriana var. granulata]
MAPERGCPASVSSSGSAWRPPCLCAPRPPRLRRSASSSGDRSPPRRVLAPHGVCQPGYGPAPSWHPPRPPLLRATRSSCLRAELRHRVASSSPLGAEAIPPTPFRVDLRRPLASASKSWLRAASARPATGRPRAASSAAAPAPGDEAVLPPCRAHMQPAVGRATSCARDEGLAPARVRSSSRAQLSPGFTRLPLRPPYGETWMLRACRYVHSNSCMHGYMPPLHAASTEGGSARLRRHNSHTQQAVRACAEVRAWRQACMNAASTLLLHTQLPPAGLDENQPRAAACR